MTAWSRSATSSPGTRMSAYVTSTTAAELIVFTVEANTHKLMAAPQTVPVESFENELVDMLTRYLRGSG